MGYNFSCPDYFEKLKLGEVPIPDLPINEKIARRAVGIFDNLRVHDIAGQPKNKDVAGDWLREIIRPVFGGVEKSGKSRFVTETFILIPKKNTKTTSAAAMGIIWICLNELYNVEGFIVGPTKDVADTCFKAAKEMIKLDPELREIFKIQEHIKTITHLVTGATLSIKTFDSTIVSGKIPAFCVLDELHEMSSNRDAANIIAELRGGMITNPMALLIIITTQSKNAPAGVFRSELEYARKVRDGIITENVSTLVVTYEFSEEFQRDETQPWRDPKYWPIVLPNLGRSVRLDRLIGLYQKANELGVEELKLWASKHLNIEIGLALHSDRWPGADFWESCANPKLTFEDFLARSEVIVGGFDGGGLDDLAGLGLIGREASTNKYLVWTHAWIFQIVLDRRKKIAPNLLDYVADGDLTVCQDDEPQSDFRAIVDLLLRVKEAGKFPNERAIGFDVYGVQDLVDMIYDAGFEEDQLYGVPQGFKLSGAIKGSVRTLKDKRIEHNGSRMMNWVVGNARHEIKGNNAYITKQASGSGKIDPLMAFFNAYVMMGLNPQPPIKNDISDFLADPIMSI